MSSQLSSADKPDRSSLKQQAQRAASWAIVGRFSAQALRILSNIVLARLLFPEAFGLTAIVWVFMTGLQMFSDLGIGPSIVYHRRGEDAEFLDTAWTIQIIRGAMITCGALLLSWPVAKIYGNPELTSLLSLTGFVGLIQGFESTALHTQQRKLKLGAVIQVELIGQVVTVVVMIVWAALSPTVWALVGGSLIGTSAKSALSHVWLPRRKHRLHWDRDSVRAVHSYGSWIFLSSIFTFIGLQGDRLLLGYYLGMTPLGVYHVATRFTEAIRTIQTRLTQSVLFPVFSETSRSEPQRLVKRYYKVRLRMDLVFLTASGLLCTMGHVLIDVLYDARYEDAGWILQVLAIQVGMGVILTSAETLLFSVGKTFYGFARSLARAIWILVGIPVSWHLAGLAGVVWCVALSESPVLVVIWFGMIKQKLHRPVLELRSLAIWGGSALLGWLVEATIL